MLAAGSLIPPLINDGREEPCEVPRNLFFFDIAPPVLWTTGPVAGSIEMGLYALGLLIL